MKRLTVVLLLVFTSLIFLFSCTEGNINTTASTTPFTTTDSSIENDSPTEKKPDKSYVVLKVRNYGKITLELYPEIAPISVQNFLNYVNRGFYDGLTFHRVIEGFMIQAGDPTGTGYGDNSLTPIKGEFAQNGVQNNLSFTAGVIGMARSNSYNSATSQFFICHEDASFLNGSYAAFGKVIDGMDVVDAIATCEKTDIRDNSGSYYMPAETIYIEKAYSVDGDEISTPDTSETTSAEEETEQPLSPQNPLPILNENGPTGEVINPTDLKGKVLIINFWGTWCPPCVNEMPHLDKIASEYSEDVKVIAIHSSSNANKCPDFIAENFKDSNIIFSMDTVDNADPYESDLYYSQLGGNGYYPYTVVVDREGAIVESFVGSRSYNEFRAIVQTYISE